jgi:hypothetical protein
VPLPNNDGVVSLLIMRERVEARDEAEPATPHKFVLLPACLARLEDRVALQPICAAFDYLHFYYIPMVCPSVKDLWRAS